MLKGAVLGWDTYEVYAGDSEQEAMDFLNSLPIIEGQHYVVVEVPNTVIAKDRGGVYRPSKLWRGEDWVALTYEEVDADGRRQFWPHWKPGAGQEQMTNPPKKKQATSTDKPWWHFWKG